MKLAAEAPDRLTRFGLASIAVGLVAAVSLLTGANAPAAPEPDPIPALITGADAGGGARVIGWSATGARLPGTDFFSYSSYSGAVRVAAGDVDGDGAAEIVTRSRAVRKPAGRSCLRRRRATRACVR